MAVSFSQMTARVELLGQLVRTFPPTHLLPWVFVLTQYLASLELPQSNYASGKLGHP